MNPTVSVKPYEFYQVFKLTANSPDHVIVGPGYLNGDSNFDGLTPSQVSGVAANSNPDSTGNDFVYTSAANGTSIIVRELNTIGPSIACAFDDPANPGNPYTVYAALCDTRINPETGAIDYVA